MLFKRNVYDYLIVGLGNPDAKYENTRHNVGWKCADKIIENIGADAKRDNFHARLFDGKIGSKRVLIMKPLTYMNNSGQAVSEAVSFYKMSPEQIIIISDDVSLDVGRLRIRRSGSAGGHNGIKDIIELIGSENIPRVKIGVGQKPYPTYDLAAWVLGNFSGKDCDIIAHSVEVAAEAVVSIITDGCSVAMNKYNN